MDDSFFNVENLEFTSIVDIEIPESLQTIAALGEMIWSVKSEEEAKSIIEYVISNDITIGYVLRMIEYISLHRKRYIKYLLLVFEELFKNPKHKPETMKVNADFGVLLSSHDIKMDYYGSTKSPEKVLSIYEENTPFYFCAFDLIEELKNAATSADFYVDLSTREYQFDDYSLSLLDIACKYGSIECFKYLIMNGAKISQFSAKMAVEGGNLEIIRILQREGIKFDKLYSWACEYHHNHICDWLLENYQSDLLTLCDSLLFYNIKSFLFLVANGFDVNKITIVILHKIKITNSKKHRLL